MNGDALIRKTNSYFKYRNSTPLEFILIEWMPTRSSYLNYNQIDIIIIIIIIVKYNNFLT